MKQKTVSLVFIGLSLVFLALGSVKAVNSVRGSIQELFFPATKVLYRATVASSNATTALGQIKNIARENTDLKSENDKLKAEISTLKENDHKMEILEKELSLKHLNADKKFVVAAVVGRVPSSYKEIVTIDKGRDDNINVGQSVLSNGFLIGRITQVLPRSSQIELISSHRFATPVVLQDSRLLGLLRGGVKGMQVEQLPIDGKIIQGEAVVTSGLTGDIPDGLPIGTVKEINSRPADIFSRVIIESPINFRKLEIVLVLN